MEIITTDKYTLVCGDCLEYMKTMPDKSVDAVITDPPYHLKSIVKRFGNPDSAPAQFGSDGAYSRHSTGFMGKAWDGGEIAHDPKTWAECLRVAKPGAYLLAFGGTRTYHRLACAIENAGWEIRDCVMWVYGSGFPKSHNVGKAIDKMMGMERIVVGEKLSCDGVPQIKRMGKRSARRGGIMGEVVPSNPNAAFITAPATIEAQQWEGWGTALKPAWEPIIVARKMVEGTVADNVLEYGTGAMNIDGCRVEGEPVPINKLEEWSGFGQKERPDYVQEMNNKGRWPANLIHDGSDEVLELFPNARSSGHYNKGSIGVGDKAGAASIPIDGLTSAIYSDSGSAARFFYCAKASKQDRDEGCEELDLRKSQKMGDGLKSMVGHPSGDIGNTSTEDRKLRNNHPTVKPTDLMRYLCRLVTPRNGIVFDPFMGSGSTGKGAMIEGFRFSGCDMESEYFEIARKRIEAAAAQMLLPIT